MTKKDFIKFAEMIKNHPDNRDKMIYAARVCCEVFARDNPR